VDLIVFHCSAASVSARITHSR